MKVPYRWLSEFVDTEASPREIAERLTMAGIEVASVAPAAPDLAGVVVAEVTAVSPHPAGHGPTVCDVSTGTGRFRVVCEAPNVRAGVRAAFAPPGTVLPGGRRIGAAPVRGTVSEGMLCSEADLSLGDDAAGILLLDPAAPVGSDLVGCLGLDDAVLEIEVTPNRPDCLSVTGVAREVAALTRGRFRASPIRVTEEGARAAELASVVIEDEELCPRYAARVVTDVTVGPSPTWLAQRLRVVGQRPINNVVDVTNYVMWELGQPLHAFDADRVTDRRIVVRRARPDEPLVTLDGQARVLGDRVLVIADAARAVAIGGVIGGANSEVTRATRTVLLEAAHFQPGSVRRTARALGLSTEASYRFERGADIEAIPDALDRAAQLIGDLASGRVARGRIDVYPRPRTPKSLDLRLARVRRVVGACPPKATVGEILRDLGFPAQETADGFRVDVPSRRRDVSLEDDLVEEVVRVWGYGEIPSTVPSGALVLTRRPRHVVVQDVVRRTLTAGGLQEVITLSFIDPAHLNHLGWAADDPRVVRLRNPLAVDRSVLRPTLLFGLLEARTGRAPVRGHAARPRPLRAARAALVVHGKGAGGRFRRQGRRGGRRGRPRPWRGRGGADRSAVPGGRASGVGSRRRNCGGAPRGAAPGGEGGLRPSGARPRLGAVARSARGAARPRHRVSAPRTLPSRCA
ncbi:MAG: phenylalanine--tRNA ligase subunit beta [Candidatus Rokuibacteriota bacterium]|nr:MAG: phenylalanine--tRNA ligase subunit beta [Candidatus Rokubacteria bacterium]